MSKKVKIILISLLSVAILALTFVTGYNLGQIPAGPSDGLDTVKQIWDIIFDDYVDRDKLDPDTLSKGAIEGMLEALDDPYSSYLDAEANKVSSSSLQGELEGIGAQVAMREEQITIIAPIVNSPGTVNVPSPSGPRCLIRRRQFSILEWSSSDKPI